MSSLRDALALLHYWPEHCTLVNPGDGAGDRIETWSHPTDPQPAAAEIEAAKAAAAQRSRIAAVAAERDRRLALPIAHDFGDARGVHLFGQTEQDLKGWDEVTKAADVIRRKGLPRAIAIATETGRCEVTPDEWDDVLLAATDARQPIWQASFALAAMDPVPDDFADDRWWL